MQPTEHRSAVGQLADDLRWLEDHCRRQPELAAHAGTLRLASALTRNVIGPFLEGQPTRPLHVAVVGGAGAGKSTVVNFLAGDKVAEANPQAGFTRHPTAFLPPGPAFQWPSYIGFMGQMHRLTEDKPASADEDVYQVKRIAPPTATTAGTNEKYSHPLAEFVIWDCPDMTTWASEGYVARLMEVAALADVIVYVASDERYNDAVPTEFLHLLVKAGKAVVVALTKMRAQDADSFIEHFRQEILGRLPKLPNGEVPAVPVVAIPHMSMAERTDPAGAGARYRVQLLNQILVQCESDDATRARTVTNAAKYLSTAGDGLLDVARRDFSELEAWKSTVTAGKSAFDERYRREYLSGEQFRRFDRFRERLTDLLELPGAGRVVGGIFWALRSPYRWTRDYVFGLVARPDVLNLSEQTVLTGALTSWLDALQAESLRKAGAHSLWKQIAVRFDSELSPQARDRFATDFRAFELKESEDLEEAGKALVDGLEKNPALLYTLRGGKFALDLVIIGSVVYFTWPPGWLLLLIPFGVSASHQFAELATRAVAEGARHRVRSHREQLVTTSLSAPLAEWLAEWPTTGGTSFEKLQQVLRRVPESIRTMEQRVAAKVAAITAPKPHENKAPAPLAHQNTEPPTA
ncbi:GTPase domain-containing protein [Gemmata sp. G18]|uniref:GTPase domain-containing protein n=1 Tax=Gemmata palustris TaxID=2822762 RepID=A0ABS5BT22_9BACT|nr:GTPase domain-containing protein [Gemmata palustris]MBP3956786.1 GTPase domain-containing protein [Gemmata palustris]